MALFRRGTRTLKKPADLAQAPDAGSEKSLAQANDAFASLERQRSWVESLAKALTERNQLNHFGEEVTLSFTPRRSPNAPDPRST